MKLDNLDQHEGRWSAIFYDWLEDHGLGVAWFWLWMLVGVASWGYWIVWCSLLIATHLCQFFGWPIYWPRVE